MHDAVDASQNLQCTRRNGSVVSALKIGNWAQLLGLDVIELQLPFVGLIKSANRCSSAMNAAENRRRHTSLVKRLATICPKMTTAVTYSRWEFPRN